MSESQDQRSWLDRVREELRNDPVEQGIQTMLREMKHIEEPEATVPLSTVPEFGEGVMSRGIALAVGQGRMISSENMPLRSDNAADCQYLIMKTPLEFDDNREPRFRFDLVHVWAGDLELNLPGARREDIAAITNDRTQAIHISHYRNPGVTPTARDLKYKNITSTKEIRIHNDNKYVHVVFRPDENKTLIRVGDSEDVQVFEGF